MRRRIYTFVVLLLGVQALASQPKVWRQDAQDELLKGESENTAITATGQIKLSPSMRQVYEAPEAFLWTLAQDARGNLYVGSGNEGQVFKVEPETGKGTVFFDADELQVHALAVDSAQNLYVGTSPNGKIYKIDSSPAGSPAAGKVFFDPQDKYIWALAFDPQGNLYAATGEKGNIYKIDKSGNGALFFESGETHIRVLTLDRKGNLIAGSDGSALLYRISPRGEAFVLYDSPLREITSIVVAEDNSIYFSAIGGVSARPETQVEPQAAPPAIAPKAAVSAQAAASALGRAEPQRKEPTRSEVYRVHPDGFVETLWSTDKVKILSLALDGRSRLIIGAGDDGKFYALTARNKVEELLKVKHSQITSLLGPIGGKIYAATSNLGSILELESDFVSEGSYTSDVLNAGSFAYWGRISWGGSTPQGTTIKLMTRSGNTEKPDKTWSPWSPSYSNENGEAIKSPPAQYLQWKAVLATTNRSTTPTLDWVEINYLQRNLAPEITSVTIREPGLRLDRIPVPEMPGASGTSVTATSALSGGQTAPGMSQRRQRMELPPRQTIQKGWRTVQWEAIDPNGDELKYSVYYRGRGESQWKLLKKDLDAKFYSWDSTSMPDGTYEIKIVASDAEDNPAGTALEGYEISKPFDVDNTPPAVENISVAVEGNSARISFDVVDTASAIREVKYSVNAGEWQAIFPLDGIADSQRESFRVSLENLESGEHTVVIRAADALDNVGSGKATITIR